MVPDACGPGLGTGPWWGTQAPGPRLVAGESMSRETIITIVLLGLLFSHPIGTPSWMEGLGVGATGFLEGGRFM